MKITTLLLIISLSQVSAAAFSQRVTLNEKNAPLEKVLKQIKKQSGFLVFYNDQDLADANKVDVDFKNTSVEDALKACFTNQPLNYSVIDKTIVIQRKETGFFDKIKSTLNFSVAVKGKVTNEKGEPMEGVTVTLTRSDNRSKGKSVLTTADGSYYIDGAAGQILVFTYVGYKTKEVTIYSQATLNVSLEPAISGLDQIVVVGYGTTKRKDLTGSVSSVNVGEVKDAPFATFDQALVGKAAGVQVVQGDGSPGGVARIRIRGGTSILGGNDPLYIIDGVQVTVQNRYIQNAAEVVNPISGADNANGSVSGAFARGLNSLGGLNINDIESIDVLKDASATAIYGSKAANGVIIITTKKGKYDQKPVMELNYNAGFSIARKEKLLNADQYKMIMKEAAQNLLTELAAKPGPPNAVANNIINDPNYLGNANTDWLKLILRNGFNQNADFSVRGGGKGSRYYTSLDYTDQDGVLKGSDFKRIAGKVRLDNDITSKLRTITNIDYGYTVTDISNGAYTQALLAPPTLAPYNADGSINTFTGAALGSYISSGIQNPLSLLTNGINRGTNASLIGSLALEYDILKDLKFRSVASINYNQYHQRDYTPSTALIVGDAGATTSNNGTGSQGQTASSTFMVENTLTYNKQFNDDNRIDVVAGTSWQQDKSSTFSASGQGYPDDNVLNDLSSAAVIFHPTSSSGQNSLLSFYARANYAFKERYLFTFTGRSDASSKFPKENRTAYFPSGGVAWRLSQENFLKKVTWINDLKLRASAGYTGTQNIGDYMFRTLYTPVSYGGTNAVIPSQLGNNTIKWESTLQKDAGLDFALFNSRLTGDIGVYEKKTSGLLFNEQLAPSSSYNSVIANIADIRNRGLEIDIRGDVFRGRKFSWNSAINFSFNRSKVTNLNQDFSDPNQSGAYLGNTIIRDGQPVGLFYGFKYQGIIANAAQLAAYKAKYTLSQFISPYLNVGDPMFEMSPYGFPSSSLVIGNSEPKFFGGFTNTFNYGSFSLTTLLNYSYGGKILYLADINNQKVIDLSNKGVAVLGRWTPDNPTATRPRVIYGQNGNIGTASNDIYNGSFIKLKTVVLTYQIPKELMDRWHLQAASIFISASNLFTITKYPGPDPEVSNDPYSLISGYSDASAYPTVKQFSIGFRLGF